MVVTMLEAEVAEENAAELTEAFRAGGESLPSVIRESFFLHEADSELWRIVTVWERQRSVGRVPEIGRDTWRGPHVQSSGCRAQSHGL
jgi:hypothetical protein